MNGPAVAALLAIFHASLDLKSTLLDKMHYLLYFCAAAINPRFMQTVDENLEPISVSVRVGQAVETVGQAGRPKTITGFQVSPEVSVCLSISVLLIKNKTYVIDYNIKDYIHCNIVVNCIYMMVFL